MGITTIAVLCGVAVGLSVYATLAPRAEERDDTYGVDFTGTQVGDPARSGSAFDRWVRPALRNFLPQTPLSAQLKARGNDKIRELLVQSGNPWNLLPEEFYGVRLLFALFGLFAGFALGALHIVPILPLPAVVLLGGVLGMYIPKVIHDKERGKRKKAATRGLPEALDLLVITLNSGMRFETALNEVVTRMPDGLVKVELLRVSQDIGSGKTLAAALLDFARRSPSPEVESFCKSVIQAEDLGADVSQTLEGQAQAAREAYEHMLDQRIGKLPTTLYFPILVFMLPSLFIMILAPAFSSLSTAL